MDLRIFLRMSALFRIRLRERERDFSAHIDYTFGCKFYFVVVDLLIA